MSLRVGVGVGLAFAAAAAFGQAGNSSPAFEVATVKPATPAVAIDGRRTIRIGVQGGPGSGDPGQISYSYQSLKALVALAFGMKPYQVQGPEWLDSERFDIVAKVPRGATKDDLKLMLLNLLKERFQLAVHNDKKEMGIYALIAAKGGPKLKASEDQSDPSAAPAAGADGAPAAAPSGPPDIGRLKLGKDGMPDFPMSTRPGISAMMVMSPAGARSKLNANRVTMTQLADSLSSQLDRPVVDNTSLTQRYDFTLDFAPEPSSMAGKMVLGGGGPMAPPGGAGMAVTSTGPAPATADSGHLDMPELDAANLFTAIQSQLGLKLESRKAAAEIVVVDHIERTPSEN